DATIRLWDVATGTQLSVLAGHAATVTTLAFEPDGARLVSASGDETVKVWSISSRRPVLTLRVPTAIGAALSGDGRRIATVDRDGRSQSHSTLRSHLVVPGVRRREAFRAGARGTGVRVFEGGRPRQW